MGESKIHRDCREDVSPTSWRNLKNWPMSLRRLTPTGTESPAAAPGSGSLAPMTSMWSTSNDYLFILEALEGLVTVYVFDQADQSYMEP